MTKNTQPKQKKVIHLNIKIFEIGLQTIWSSFGVLGYEKRRTNPEITLCKGMAWLAFQKGDAEKIFSVMLRTNVKRLIIGRF